MQISPKGIALIKEFEGCRLTAYQDSVGVWTIGYGWTNPVDGKPVKAGMQIKQETAERLLKTGLVSYEADVSRMLKVGVTQCQFDALVSFCYNLGAKALSTSTLMRKLNAGAVRSRGKAVRQICYGASEFECLRPAIKNPAVRLAR